MGYLGSKAASGAFQAIISQMPPHDTYIELFLGSGAVMRAKPAALHSYGVDLNYECITGFQHRENLELIHLDAFCFLEGFDFSSAGKVLIYADPPYLLSTRTSAKRYKHEFTEQDHAKLISILHQVPASVILSGYPSKKYDELLFDWRSITFQAMTRGGPRTEQLWMNFDTSGAHWATFAGKNFTDRQRIKRKAGRWAKDYELLPTQERLAILAGILNTHSRTS